jgi:hypothetical protein
MPITTRPNFRPNPSLSTINLNLDGGANGTEANVGPDDLAAKPVSKYPLSNDGDKRRKEEEKTYELA